METMFKSNTARKLAKIMEGSVFTSPKAFIVELLQNAQRAKASKVEIQITGDKFVIKDNGCGCSTPDALFELDSSEWNSTTEGFGMGFWSVLAIPNTKSISVKSGKWSTNIDPEAVRGGDLTVSVENNDEKTKGFEVSIISEYFAREDMRSKVEDVAKYITDFTTVVNGEIIKSCSPLETARVNEGFYHKRINTRLFEGVIVATEYNNGVELFYEGRKVTTLYHFSHCSGVINVKTGALTLKEPDRQEIIRNEKWYAFSDRVESTLHDIYKEYVNSYGIDNREAVGGISRYLKAKEYEAYLDFAIKIPKKEPEAALEPVIPAEKTLTTILTAAAELNEKKFSAPNESKMQVTAAAPIREAHAKKSKKVNVFAEKLKKVKMVMWVDASDINQYKDAIAKAEYNGIQVLIAKNVLYENVYSARRIPHISELESCMTEIINRSNIELKTNKEKAFIALLTPIAKMYGLAEDTFMIANLDMTVEFTLNGKTSRKKLKNKKGHIEVYGLTNGRNIWLDRTGIALYKFNIQPGRLANPEIKALMWSIETISHELAHLLFKTVDNTPEHYKKQIEIQRQIMELYM